MVKWIFIFVSFLIMLRTSYYVLFLAIIICITVTDCKKEEDCDNCVSSSNAKNGNVELSENKGSQLFGFRAPSKTSSLNAKQKNEALKERERRWFLRIARWSKMAIKGAKKAVKYGRKGLRAMKRYGRKGLNMAKRFKKKATSYSRSFKKAFGRRGRRKSRKNNRNKPEPEPEYEQPYSQQSYQSQPKYVSENYGPQNVQQGYQPGYYQSPRYPQRGRAPSQEEIPPNVQEYQNPGEQYQ